MRGPEVRSLECGGLTPPWNRSREEGQRAGGSSQLPLSAIGEGGRARARRRQAAALQGGLRPQSGPRLVGLRYSRVDFFRMKRLTLSADADLIERARAVARTQHKTLNAAFREWLQHYTAYSVSAQEVDSLMKRLRHVHVDRHFTRAEMNER